MMMLSVILIGMQIVSAYRVMQTSAEQEQPDERWFRSNNRRSAQTPEIQEQQDFSTDTYQPRYNSKSHQRFSRYQNAIFLSDEECLELIKSELRRGSFENPLEECEKIHDLVMRYLRRS
jgi:hypothetical protein